MFSLHHVQLAIPAGGEDEGRGFYGDVLGLDEVPKPPTLATRGGAWFRGGGLEIHLGIEVRPDGLLPGFQRFYVDDCFGNRLEFLRPDPWA